MTTASPTRQDTGCGGPFARTELRQRRSDFRYRRLVLALLLVIPSLGRAVSLFDVVRLTQEGYPDAQIIDLIDDTGARFRLDADSLVTLKEAGVSESVIQALITATATEPAGGVTAGGSESTDPGSHDADVHGGKPHGVDGAAEGASAPPSKRAVDRAAHRGSGLFSAHPFDESGTGHGGSHQHYALAVQRVFVLVLRSESHHRSIAERAREVTAALDEVTGSEPGGRFFASAEPDPAVWYRPATAGRPSRILSVGRGDVIAYQRRSLGAVSKSRLAAYWAALLNDYSRVFIYNLAPRDLVQLHLGEALMHVYEKLQVEEADTDNGSSLGSSRRILRALDHLTAEDKEHLLELATRVPAEFVEGLGEAR